MGKRGDLHRAQHEMLILSEMDVRGDRVTNCVVGTDLYIRKIQIHSRRYNEH